MELDKDNQTCMCPGNKLPNANGTCPEGERFCFTDRSYGRYCLLFDSSYERKGCTLSSKYWSRNGEVHNMP